MASDVKEKERLTKIGLKSYAGRTGCYAYYSGKSTNENDINGRELMESRGYRANIEDVGPATSTLVPVRDDHGHAKYEHDIWEDEEGNYHNDRYAVKTYVSTHKSVFQYYWYKLFRSKEESDLCAQKERKLNGKLSKADWVTMGRVYRYEHENPKVRELKKELHVDYATVKPSFIMTLISSVVLFLAMLLGFPLMVLDSLTFFKDIKVLPESTKIPTVISGALRAEIFAAVFLIFGLCYLIARYGLKIAERGYSLHREKVRKAEVLVYDYLDLNGMSSEQFAPWREMKRILQRIETPFYVWMVLIQAVIFGLAAISKNLSFFIMKVELFCCVLIILYLIFFICRKKQLRVIRKAFIACNLDRQYYEKHIPKWRRSAAMMNCYEEYCVFRSIGTGMEDGAERMAEKKAIANYEEVRKIKQKEKDEKERLDAHANF